MEASMFMGSRHLALVAGLLTLCQAACGDADAQLHTTADISPADAAASRSAAQTAACNFEGTWALKFTIPVAWAGNAGVQAGQGEIVQWARTERTQQGSEAITEHLVACGSTVPDYKSQAMWGGETFGTRFADALFDSGRLQPRNVITHLSGAAPGHTYASDVVPTELGVAMADPLHDPWPSSAQALLPFAVDSDGDGRPGISLQTAHGDGLSRPPVSYNRRRRATHFDVAVRDLTSSTGRIVSCNRFEGTAHIPTMDGCRRCTRVSLAARSRTAASAPKAS
jgi:hypothetical protein